MCVQTIQSIIWVQTLAGHVIEHLFDCDMRTARSVSRFASALQQAETRTPAADVCWKLRISEATFYRWRERYGGDLTGFLNSEIEAAADTIDTISSRWWVTLGYL
jgi:Transposase